MIMDRFAGPISFLGEQYDSRLELTGWNTNDYDETTWQDVLVDDQVIVNLVAQRNEPVQIHEILCPINISEPTEHTYIINMGQNLVGWVQFTIEGEEGQQIQLRHGEMLDL